MARTGRTVRPRLGVLVTSETLQNVIDRANAAQESRTLPGLTPGLSPRTVARGPQLEDGTPIPRIAAGPARLRR
jgi:hypothetical protein